MDKKFYNYMTNLDTSIGVTKFELENAKRGNIYNKILKLNDMHADASAGIIRKYQFGPDDLEVDNQFMGEYQGTKDKICENITKELKKNNTDLQSLHTPRGEEDSCEDFTEKIVANSRSRLRKRIKIQPPKKTKSKLQEAFQILTEDIKSTSASPKLRSKNKETYKEKLDVVMDELLPTFYENEQTQITLGGRTTSLLDKIQNNFNSINCGSNNQFENPSTYKTKSKQSETELLVITNKASADNISNTEEKKLSDQNISIKDKNMNFNNQPTIKNDQKLLEKHTMKDVPNKDENDALIDLEENINTKSLKTSPKKTKVYFSLGKQTTRNNNSSMPSPTKTFIRSKNTSEVGSRKTTPEILTKEPIIKQTVYHDNYKYNVVKTNLGDLGIDLKDIKVQENPVLNAAKQFCNDFSDGTDMYQKYKSMSDNERVGINTSFEEYTPENNKKVQHLTSLNSQDDSIIEKDKEDMNLEKGMEREGSTQNSAKITYDNSASGQIEKEESVESITPRNREETLHTPPKKKKTSKFNNQNSVVSEATGRNGYDNNLSFSRKNSENVLAKDNTIYNTLDSVDPSIFTHKDIEKQLTTQNISILKNIAETDSVNPSTNFEIVMNENNINLTSTFPTVKPKNTQNNKTAIFNNLPEVQEFMHYGVEYFEDENKKTKDFKNRLVRRLPHQDAQYFNPKFRVRPRNISSNKSAGQVIISKRLNGIKIDHVENKIIKNKKPVKKKDLNLRYQKSIFPDNFKIYPYENDEKGIGVFYDYPEWDNNTSFGRNSNSNQPSLNANRKARSVNLTPHKLREKNIELTRDEKMMYEERIKTIQSQSKEKHEKMRVINSIGKKYQNFEKLKNVQNAIVYKSYLDDYQRELKRKMYPLLQEAQKSMNNSNETRTMIKSSGKDLDNRFLIKKFAIFELDKSIPDVTLDDATKAKPIKLEDNTPPSITDDNAHDYLRWLKVQNERKLQHGFLKFASNNHEIDNAYVDNMDLNTLVEINKLHPNIGNNFHPAVAFKRQIEDGRHLITKETMKEFVVENRLDDAKKELTKEGIYKACFDVDLMDNRK